jgi:curved DNA-binding protein CbpA
VQQAYRARAKAAHPDRTGDDGEAMAELNATYASLRNGWRYGLFGDA